MDEPRRKSPASFRELREIGEGGPGVSFKDARQLFVDVPLKKEEAAGILPWGLRPSDPAMGTLIMARYPVFPYGVPYHEAILMIHVRSLLGSGLHCAWILVDDDAALIAGREFLGYPKKMGEFTHEDDGTTLRASVARRGVELISVTARREEPESGPAPFFGRKHFHLGGPGQMMALSPLLMFKPREQIHESWRASVELALADSLFDPVARLVAGEPTSARMARLDVASRPVYFLPVGLSGGRRWFLNTFNMRFR